MSKGHSDRWSPLSQLYICVFLIHTGDPLLCSKSNLWGQAYKSAVKQRLNCKLARSIEKEEFARRSYTGVISLFLLSCISMNIPAEFYTYEYLFLFVFLSVRSSWLEDHYDLDWTLHARWIFLWSYLYYIKLINVIF